MAFQLSPGVLVVEKDLTSIIPAVATSTGAFAGAFVWGPVLDVTQITSENNLVSRFGRPQDGNAASWLSAANFLSYTNNLQVVRFATQNQKNAVAVETGSVTSIQISNGGANYATATATFSDPSDPNGTTAVGTVVLGEGGVVEGITFSAEGTTRGTGYSSNATVTITGTAIEGEEITDAVVVGVVTTGGVVVNNENDYLLNYVNGNGLVGMWAAKFPGALGNSLRVELADSGSYEGWDYAAEFDSAPDTSVTVDAAGGANDEVHIIVIDEDGAWTGTRGAILEKFAFASKASDARKTDGTNNYYRDVINTNSKYIWWMDHPTANDLVQDEGDVVGALWGAAAQGTTFATLDGVKADSLSGGADDLAFDTQDVQNAYDIFQNAELYDISLVVTGALTPNQSKYIIENVGDTRRDCVVFVSPSTPEGSVIQGLDVGEATRFCRQGIDAYASNNLNVSSSYGVMDSGWKYQYDRYNDVYRWVPLNGDIAGLCARTDYTNDAWWSPGGLNRGQIKNVVKLSFNPNQAERDELYKAGVNPVVSFPGQGTVLFGDKTMLAKPSAFDRINVRRLFIVLEKAIATAAKYQLFEFNDSFTRAQFRSMVEPFLRDVQGRRGVIDFRVKCDETNNTGEVIDRNEFVADIFIKPNRSINFITLNFIAARTAVSFDEIGG